MLPSPATFTAWTARQNRGEQIVALLELSHPQLLEPIRAVSDVKDITVNGVTFQKFPFGFQFPGEGETIPRCDLSIQNVDKRIGHAVKNLKGAMAATLSAVLREDPDQIIIDVPRLYLVNVVVNGAFATGTLIGRRNANSAWPGVRATPELTPGLHWS